MDAGMFSLEGKYNESGAIEHIWLEPTGRLMPQDVAWSRDWWRQRQEQG